MVNKKLAMQKAEYERNLRQILDENSFTYRQIVLDRTAETFKRMGLGEDFKQKFIEEYKVTESDFCKLIITDNDKMLEYSKDYIDRVLKQRIPEDMFLPYEVRYGCGQN